MTPRLIAVDTEALSIAALSDGADDGWPVLLLHGFPYDPLGYDAVVELLVAGGARVVRPYLRGFGPTRFATDDTVRSGQQGAIGSDAAELVEALAIAAPITVGYDWGGRAACVLAARWPERVAGLVAIGGNEIQDIAASGQPQSPEHESRAWYQYYFHSERGRAGLDRHRRELAAQLWREWSPGRPVAHEEFERTAPSLDNPDFVDVVVHSYRHRFGLAAGDPRYDEIERFLATGPTIGVPTIVLDPTEDPMIEPRSRERHAESFTALVDHRLVPSGHQLPFDAPDAVVQAVLDLHDTVH